MTSQRALNRTFYLRVFTLAVTGVMGVLTWQILAPVLEPLCWAVLFAVLLHPAQLWLTRRVPSSRTKLSRGLSIHIYQRFVAFCGIGFHAHPQAGA